MADHHTLLVNRILSRYGDSEDSLMIAEKRVTDMVASEGWGIIQTLLMDSSIAANDRLIHGSQDLSHPQLTRAIGFIEGVKQPQVAAESFALAREALAKRNKRAQHG